VDKAESEPVLCRKINATGPALLAEEAKRLGACLVHYSTDFVFDGARDQPYKETDVPFPLGVYGKTKHEGDLAIQLSGVPHLIFRLAWVYGLHGKNFLLTMRRLAQEGKPLRVVNDQVGCPTWSRVAAEVTASALAMMDKPDAPFSFREASGLYHAVCSGATSWHGFARAFINSEVPIQPITTADYPAPARRPAYSVLDCTKLQHTFGITLPAWDKALQDCLKSG
jgi:dTDP-4-dehydrorhamnose reductase